MKHTLESLLALAESDDGRQQIRILVANLVGWSTWEGSENYPSPKVWTAPDGRARCWCDIPEYHTSLDAIMPEVRKLDEKSAEKWANFMADIFYKKGNLGWQVCYAIATAEAIHASIAFILTKQKP